MDVARIHLGSAGTMLGRIESVVAPTWIKPLDITVEDEGFQIGVRSDWLVIFVGLSSRIPLVGCNA